MRIKHCVPAQAGERESFKTKSMSQLPVFRAMFQGGNETAIGCKRQLEHMYMGLLASIRIRFGSGRMSFILDRSRSPSVVMAFLSYI